MVLNSSFSFNKLKKDFNSAMNSSNSHQSLSESLQQHNSQSIYQFSQNSNMNIHSSYCDDLQTNNGQQQQNNIQLAYNQQQQQQLGLNHGVLIQQEPQILGHVSSINQTQQQQQQQQQTTQTKPGRKGAKSNGASTTSATTTTTRKRGAQNQAAAVAAAQSAASKMEQQQQHEELKSLKCEPWTWLNSIESNTFAMEPSALDKHQLPVKIDSKQAENLVEVHTYISKFI